MNLRNQKDCVARVQGIRGLFCRLSLEPGCIDSPIQPVRTSIDLRPCETAQWYLLSQLRSIALASWTETSRKQDAPLVPVSPG